ncbi:hypothetical protein E0485_10300, partial [Paenibacillus albiflavus]
TSPISVIGVELDETDLTLTGIGSTKQLHATVLPVDATNKAVTWISSNEMVATVDQDGFVTAISKGAVVITVMTDDGGFTATSTVTVEAGTTSPIAVTDVAIDQPTVTIPGKGLSVQLNAIIEPADATNKAVTWSTSDQGIAKVNEDGKVTAVSKGTAIITVTTDDGGLIATSTVTVEEGSTTPIDVTGVELDRSEVTLTNVGSSVQLHATVLPADATNKAVTWNSSNAGVATVNQNGVVKAVSSGRAIITVTTLDGGFEATSLVTVNVNRPDPEPESPVDISPSGPMNSGGSSAPANPGVYVVKSKELVDSLKKDNPSLTIHGVITEIQFSAGTLNLFSGRNLEIILDQITFVVSSDLMNKLASQLSQADLKSGTVSIKVNQLSQMQLANLLNELKHSDGESYKATSQAFDIQLILNKNGKQPDQVTQLPSPMTVKLKMDPLMNPRLMGFYYINSSGKPDYIGGTIINGEFIVELHHLSRYALMEYHKVYADVSESHWANLAIQELAAKHIVSGTSEQLYEPNREVSRAEFAAMLVRMLNLQSTGKSTFVDVSTDKWYSEAVLAAAEAGIVSGTGDNRFNPEANISREEMIVMLMRAYGINHRDTLPSHSLATFADDTQTAPWALQAVHAAAQLGLIKGYADHTFSPQANTTRAEAAMVIVNLLNHMK